MAPLRAKMIRDMPLQRLAPKTQKASVTAVAGLAKCYQCSPDRLRPERIRTYLHHLLVERRLAWRSCNQAAAGLKFFYTKTLGWDVRHLHLPPRTGRSQLPQILSIEELQRLFTQAKNPRHRVLLMTTYAAGLRVGEVVRLKLTDIASERMLLRVEQGKGRKDRSTLLSTRLLTGLDSQKPCPSARRRRSTIRRSSARGSRTAMVCIRCATVLRPTCAKRALMSGTIQMLLGYRSLDTTTRYLRITR